MIAGATPNCMETVVDQVLDDGCLLSTQAEAVDGTLNRYNSVEQLRKAIGQFIHYYNHQRIRLTLKGLSPVQYRIQALAAWRSKLSNFWGQFMRRFFA